jgi:hypothetical protein
MSLEKTDRVLIDRISARVSGEGPGTRSPIVSTLGGALRGRSIIGLPTTWNSSVEFPVGLVLRTDHFY